MKLKELKNNKVVKDFSKSILKKVFDEISSHIISNSMTVASKYTTLSLNISSYSMTYNNFYTWFCEHKKDDTNSYFVSNNEKHYFFYKKHLFSVMNLYDADTKMRSYSIKMYGKNKKVIKSLYEEFRYKPSKNTTIYTSTPMGDWRYTCEVQKRDMSTVIINQDIKDSILKRIKDWEDSREWYISRGLAYKLGLVFYGPPGTGKTSFIKSLASYIGYDLYILDLNSQSDSSLSRILSSTGRKSIIIMEDFDSSKSTLARDEATSIKLDKPISTKDEEVLGVTTSGLLNAIDGLVPLDDRIIIMTTNLLEKVDSALVRKGRIDEMYYFGPLKDVEIKEYINVMCPNYKLEPSIVFEDINGCDIQDLYLQNKFKDEEFVKSIPRKKF